MAATYQSMAQPTFGGSHWDRAVPAVHDDADQYYGGGAAQYRTLKSQKHTQTTANLHANGYTSDSSSYERGGLGIDTGRKRSIGSGTSETNVDDSAWIHRDKLAQIESKEMASAGLRVRRPSSRSDRSRSRSATRSSSRHSRRQSRTSELSAGYGSDDAGRTIHGYDRATSPAVPPLPAGLNSARASELVETSGFGFEEVEESAQARQRSISRPGTSRIPISRNSPAPLSNAALDRESPLVRSRQGSLALSSSPEMTRTRHERRSQSMGSHAMLDASGLPQPRTPRSRPVSAHLSSSPYVADSSASDSYTSPSTQSNSKPAGLNVKKATSHSRKSSASKSRNITPSSTIARDSPASTITPRPKSSSANVHRRRSTHSPEGEAPWIATMYKPDPMLPPDQQILPTHAKKMMQEQWAREGKIGDTYDRNFNLVNANDPTGGKMPPVPPPAKAAPGQDEGAADESEQETFPKPWAGNPADSPRASGASRAGSTGGYRITPTISQSSPVLTRDNAPHGTGVQGAKRHSVYRLQTAVALPGEGETMPSGPPVGAGGEVEEKIRVHRLDPQKIPGREGKEKKGCCCIVM